MGRLVDDVLGADGIHGADERDIVVPEPRDHGHAEVRTKSINEMNLDQRNVWGGLYFT